MRTAVLGMLVASGALLAVTVWQRVEAPSAPMVVSTETQLVTYQSSVLGLTFTYPEKWGEVVTTEVEPDHFHLSFSGVRSGADGRPAPFVAYRLPGYVNVGRGGYWGDLVTKTPATLCTELAGVDCTYETNTRHVSYAKLQGVPAQCEAEGSVSVHTYVVPRPVGSVVEPAIVLSDEAVVSGEDCFTYDHAAATAFAAVVASMSYVE